MFRYSFLAAALVAGLLTIAGQTPGKADTATAGALKISAPWARATPKGASVGGGYMTVTNTGTTPDRLIGGSTAIAGRFEVHEMSMDNGIMKMRMLPKGIEIKPGETVAFKPGSYHLMFMDLKQPLTLGQHFKTTLQFEKAGKVDVDFAVEGIGAQAPAGAAAGGGHNMPGVNMKH